MQVNDKIFEVDQVVCHRINKGKEEYLVYWKGFESSTATWEPVENLLSCKDLIEQFHRLTNPIPGANPHSLIRTEKAKTIHVKMLLTRKNKQKRTKSMPDADQFVESLNDSTKTLDTSLPLPYKRKGLSESEKLIRDTLLHESKTMKPEKTSLNRINGIFECYENSLKQKNGISKRTCEFVVCTVSRSYMTITLNNTRRHNVLTLDMLDTICDCLIKARKNSDVKAVLLCNNGDHFCSGIDYTDLINCTDDKVYKHKVTDLVSSIRNLLECFFCLNKPIIAAVNGPALEFGMSLVVACDIAYATSKATFDLMYNKFNLTPIGLVTQLLPDVVGRSMASSMMYLGGHYAAVTACDRGLVMAMYGVNSFAEDIEKKMLQLTSNSLPVLEATKKLVRHFDAPQFKEICDEELKVYQQQLTNKETRAKMKEDWTMRINLFSDI